MRGYVATGELALEVSHHQLVSGSRRDQSSKRALVSPQRSAVLSVGSEKLPVL
jgi:hypothetical protein